MRWSFYFDRNWTIDLSFLKLCSDQSSWKLMWFLLSLEAMSCGKLSMLVLFCQIFAKVLLHIIVSISLALMLSFEDKMPTIRICRIVFLKNHSGAMLWQPTQFITVWTFLQVFFGDWVDFLAKINVISYDESLLANLFNLNFGYFTEFCYILDLIHHLIGFLSGAATQDQIITV